MRHQSPIAEFVWHRHVDGTTYDYEIYVNKEGICLGARYAKDETKAEFTVDKKFDDLVSNIASLAESKWKRIDQIF
jgi:hypothetical protein